MASGSVLEIPTQTRALPVDDTGWPLLPPTLLTVHRTSPDDEQSRQIVCALDGRRFAELLYRQTHTHEIYPGRHRLRVHNTLMWRNVEFEAEPGAHVHFTVVNRSGRGYLPLLLVIGVAPLWLAVHPGPPAAPSASR